MMKMRRWKQRFVGMAALLMLVWVGSVLAQPGTPAQGPTLVELQTRLKHAQSETELEPKLKQDVVELYQAAIERIEIANEATATAKSFLQRMDSISEELRQTKAALAALPAQPTLTVAIEDDIDKLERMLSERRKLLDEPDRGLRAKVAVIEKELNARKSRLEEITKEQAEIDERLGKIQEGLDAPPSPEDPRELTQARTMLLLTRRMRAIEERTALQAEQAWYESDEATNLLRAQRDLAAKELAKTDAEAQLLQDAVDQRRGSEADRRVRAAEQVVARTSPVVKPVAETNLSLAKESREVALALRETSQRVDVTRENRSALKTEFEQTTTMVEAVGLTESIGLLLRQQRAKLSDTRGLHARLAQRGETVRDARMRMFQIEADIAALRDLDAAATKTALELTSGDAVPTAPPAKALASAALSTQHLADEAKPLLEQRRELLERLNDDYNTHFKKLVALDNDERTLLEATRQYADYIDERVLWIRTGTMFGGTHGTRAALNTTWLTDQVNWKKVVDAVRVDVQHEPLPYMFAFVALLLWIGLQWTLRSRLSALGTTAVGESCHELFPTIQAIVLTGLLAAAVPALLAFAGWRLDHSVSPSKFVHAVAGGLLRAATFAAPLELLRWMVSRGGLAQQHFDWLPLSIVRLRRHLNWFVPTGIVLVGMVGMVEATADEQRLDSLGRLGYLVFAGLLALFCQRAFPKRLREALPIPAVNSQETQAARRAMNSQSEVDVWMNRLARLGTLLAVTVPVGLLLLSWSGYFYTALQLTWRLQASVWLVMGLVLVRGSVLRWITLERRRMAVLQAKELQAITQAGKHPETESHTPFLFPRWAWPDFRLNLTQIVTQMRSLLDTGLLTVAAIGLWLVWADVAPALNILDRVPLWQTTVEEVVPSKDANDKPVVQVVTRPKSITAANLGLALLIMAIASVAGRNIPGLIEVILLEHLSVDAGIRFATTCLVRYAIFIAGVCFAFNQIGIGWNSVQWLVAAASVGLGFGLQEIFANFVSGIILLFERPMRVGDVITIGSTTGTVSRIRFRATTVIDGDRKELIVPNKSFITGNLLNWTLSDSINRVAIKVCAAYGSEPERVRELLLKIASEHSALLKEPAPTATLDELGDSALIFQLRAFLPSLKDRQRVTHELNARIHEGFRAAGIEIPFPQQEVSLRVVEPKSQPSRPTTEAPLADLHGSLENALKQVGVSV